MQKNRAIAQKREIRKEIRQLRDSMSQDEMEHLIRSAGYEPRQRTNLYERFVTREDTAEVAALYRSSLRGWLACPGLPSLWQCLRPCWP